MDASHSLLRDQLQQRLQVELDQHKRQQGLELKELWKEHRQQSKKKRLVHSNFDLI